MASSRATIRSWRPSICVVVQVETLEADDALQHPAADGCLAVEELLEGDLEHAQPLRQASVRGGWARGICKARDIFKARVRVRGPCFLVPDRWGRVRGRCFLVPDRWGR